MGEYRSQTLHICSVRHAYGNFRTTDILGLIYLTVRSPETESPECRTCTTEINLRNTSSNDSQCIRVLHNNFAVLRIERQRHSIFESDSRNTEDETLDGFCRRRYPGTAVQNYLLALPSHLEFRHGGVLRLKLRPSRNDFSFISREGYRLDSGHPGNHSPYESGG